MPGPVKPYLFAYCDIGYYEKYGKALELSARAHGHECDAICSGEMVKDEQSKIRHSHWRYHLLPEILEKHGPTLMLDADCVIRKPIMIEEEYRLGIVYEPNMLDYQRCVNGGCVYMVPNLIPLALKMKERINFQHWFDDQIVLFRLCVKHGNYKTKMFSGEFFSWRNDPNAAIWTGKGKNKFRQPFMDEVSRCLEMKSA